jgi:hypothetical protein
MTVTHPTSRDEFQNLVQSGKVIVDFSATWCK